MDKPTVKNEPAKKVEQEVTEPYRHSMSPEPIPSTALTQEDKDGVPLLTTSEDNKAIVRRGTILF